MNECLNVQSGDKYYRLSLQKKLYDPGCTRVGPTFHPLSINKIMTADKGAICHSRRSKAYSFQASGSIKV